LAGKTCGYLLWGVHNDTHALIGSTFNPATARKGNEELENWLLRLLEPRIDFNFDSIEIDNKRIVLLRIAAAVRHPVRFSGAEFIRIGSYKKPLKEFPEKERALWRTFDRVPFEIGVAIPQAKNEEVLRLLEFSSYFDLLDMPLPENQSNILDILQRDQIIFKNDSGSWDITQLGAILFAKHMENFPSIFRKSVRIIQYKGRDRTQTLRERQWSKGYANGFAELLDAIYGLLPTNEVMGKALRRDVPMFPALAVRELVANALIHQDFSLTGTGPVIEIFDERLEITNPGDPLVEPDRFLDSPPRSRNEALASLMRRLHICEERGSGIDKVVSQVELYQLPPPLFEVWSESTRVVLFAPRPLDQMDKEERLRACYWHACLKYVRREQVTNTTIRERFGIEEQNRASASRLLGDAVSAGFLILRDPDSSRSQRQYLPWWAAASKRGGA
jgi:predicted HTH transcriptional regulator